MNLTQGILDVYFHNTVKAKDFQSFKETTPQGNIIEGYIYRKPNRFLGSLLITKLNNKEYERPQFVQSMPKIHYLKEREKTPPYYHLKVTEKLDGTCIITYPLKDHNNKTIEIIPKTRGKAVADKHILSMWNKIDHKNITTFYENHQGSLMFELYGVLNKHEIIYNDTYIDAKLIGAYTNHFVSGFELFDFAYMHDFNMPNVLYEIKKDSEDDQDSSRYVIIASKEIESDSHLVPGQLFSSLYECVDKIKDDMEYVNQRYKERNGRLRFEGGVINTYGFDGNFKYIKIKPPSILEFCTQNDGVPAHSIRKEIYKFFDEYSIDFITKSYQEDPKFYEKQIIEWLSEEYNEDVINYPKTKKRIESVFLSVWNSKLPTKSEQNIVDELVNNHPNTSIQELMSIFSQQYPSKRKQARKIYSILKQKIGEVK